MPESELHHVANPIVRVEGAQSPAEAIHAMRIGVHAPEHLSFDPQDSDYDAQWCRMVRAVLLNGEPVDDVISFDIRRGHISQLVRDAHERHAFEYRGPVGGGPFNGCGHMHYQRRDLEGHVTVTYGIPIEMPVG